jgi:hypothetical protein
MDCKVFNHYESFMNQHRMQQSIIQWECQQLLNRMTTLTDQRDWEALAMCYTEDAVLARPSDPDNPIVGRDAILTSLKARPLRATAHLVGNSVFDIVTPEKVEVVSRVWLVSGPVDDNSLPVISDSPIIIGTFTDQLVWVDGTWLNSRRMGSIELKHG